MTPSPPMPKGLFLSRGVPPGRHSTLRPPKIPYLAPMPSINEIVKSLEGFAPTPLQEAYDNCGLLTGHPHTECTGVLTTLDVTASVLREAREK